MAHDADGQRPITMGHMKNLISVGINGQKARIEIKLIGRKTATPVIPLSALLFPTQDIKLSSKYNVAGSFL